MTIVTQCSLDRLDRLEAMCQSWGGLVSCAVHLPDTVPDGGLADGQGSSQGSGEDLAEVMEKLMRLHARVEAAGKCRLYLTTLTEDLTDCLSVVKNMYPINTLRNGE